MVDKLLLKLITNGGESHVGCKCNRVCRAGSVSWQHQCVSTENQMIKLLVFPRSQATQPLYSTKPLRFQASLADLLSSSRTLDIFLIICQDSAESLHKHRGVLKKKTVHSLFPTILSTDKCLCSLHERLSNSREPSPVCKILRLRTS